MSEERIRQSFEFELGQFRQAIAQISDNPSVAELRAVCQFSRSLMAAVEEWLLLEKALPQDVREQATASHADGIYAVRPFCESAGLGYVVRTLEERLQKLPSMSYDSVVSDLRPFLTHN